MTPEERQEIRRMLAGLDGNSYYRQDPETGRLIEIVDKQSVARLLADYDHLVERERAVAREMLRREEAVTRSISVPKADYDHLVEVAREFDETVRHGHDYLTPEQHTALRNLRALIDPATPEPVEGEPQ